MSFGFPEEREENPGVRDGPTINFKSLKCVIHNSKRSRFSRISEVLIRKSKIQDSETLKRCEQFQGRSARRSAKRNEHGSGFQILDFQILDFQIRIFSGEKEKIKFFFEKEGDLLGGNLWRGTSCIDTPVTTTVETY